MSLQGQEDMRVHKGTRVQMCKDTRVQEHKDSRAQEGMKASEDEVTGT